MSTEIHSVIVTLRNPVPGVEGDGGQITYGYYVLEGDKLTMTDSKGVAIRRHTNGDYFTHKLAPDDNPRLIAGRLTKTIRTMIHGEDNGFYRPLNYPNIGVA